MSNKDDSMLKDSELYQVFRLCKQLGAVAMVHAENGCLIEEVDITSSFFKFIIFWFMRISR